MAYYAESTIAAVLSRIPESISEKYDVEALVIDDASTDKTFELSTNIATNNDYPFKVRALTNPVNQGYGGNQKIGYEYAISEGFDIVALIHGDGQYAPECLEELLEPLQDPTVDAVFGSRMLTPNAALMGGMPFYKYVGNKLLTKLQNLILGSSITEFHSGYRIYKVAALAKTPFHLNSNDFHFDTEIIIQFLFANQTIIELPIPTHYGNEICRVNGIRYAANVLKSVAQARLQALGIFYDPKFDLAPEGRNHYTVKLHYDSPHRRALDQIRAGSNVLDLGSAGGELAIALQTQLGCHVTCIDKYPASQSASSSHQNVNYIQHNLDQGPPNLDYSSFDYILLLDVIEHLAQPEKFLKELHTKLAEHTDVTLIASTGNVAFIIPRVMLFLGQFNYGKRGILDLTHVRLFTMSSFARLFDNAQFRIKESFGIPGPYPLAIGDNRLSRSLLRINSWLIKINKRLFSYQILLIGHPRPSLKFLLSRSIEESKSRALMMDKHLDYPISK